MKHLLQKVELDFQEDFWWAIAPINLHPVYLWVKQAASAQTIDNIAPAPNRRRPHLFIQESGPSSVIQTWHRAIFAGSYPPTIVAAVAFHNRVRDGSEWGHYAMDTRKLVESLIERNPEACI
jgi:hypothetical protein